MNRAGNAQTAEQQRDKSHQIQKSIEILQRPPKAALLLRNGGGAQFECAELRFQRFFQRIGIEIFGELKICEIPGAAAKSD